MTTITRLAIVNRGAAAMRLINAAREYAAEHHRDIRIVARAHRGTIAVRCSSARPTRRCCVEGAISARRPRRRSNERSDAAAASSGVGRLGSARPAAGVRRAVRPTGHHQCRPRARHPRPHRRSCSLAGGRRRQRRASRCPRCRSSTAATRGTSTCSSPATGTARSGSLGVHDGTLQRRSEKVLVESAREWVDRCRHDSELRSVAIRAGVAHRHRRRGDDRVRPRGTDSDVSLLRISGGLPLGHGVTEITERHRPGEAAAAHRRRRPTRRSGTRSPTVMRSQCG